MRMQKEDNRTKVSARVNQSLKERFEDAIEASPHDSQSEALRTMLEDFADRHAPDDARSDGGTTEPGDEYLRTALEVIREMSGRRGKVDADSAISRLAEQTRIPAPAIKFELLQPLEAGGWIRPRWGTIYLVDEVTA